MTTTELLAKLAARCVAMQVHCNAHLVEVSPDRAAQWYEAESAEPVGDVDWSAPMLWRVLAFPNDPTAAYAAVSHDLRAVLSEMLDTFGARRPVA